MTTDSQAPRVLVVGSINLDLVVQSERLPAAGETVIGGQFYQAAGGKGANQAVAAARSGAAVRMVAAVGDDDFGRRMIAQLRDEQIDVSSVAMLPERATGVALILVDHEGQNQISVASGANAELSVSRLEALDSTVFEHGVCLCCLESPLASIAIALRRARQHGLTCILNPAPASPDCLHSGILEHTDILTPNETEAALLTGVSTDDRAGVEHAAERLRDLGVGTVVITRGSQGLFVLTSDHREFLPAHHVTPVDATAAGDAFNGTLAAQLAAGQPLRSAIRFANAAAAVSVTRRGAQPSLPNANEVEDFLNRAESSS